DNHFLAGLEVYFATGGQQMCSAEFDVLVVGDGQVVIGLDLGFAVGMGGAVFFGQQFGIAVGFDAVVAFVADADMLVVLDVLIPVALGVDEDLFFTSLVFNTQFVEAVATGAAEGFEGAAGLVLRQAVRDLVGLVVQATGDQRLIEIGRASCREGVW